MQLSAVAAVDLEIISERNRHVREIERDCTSLYELQTTLATFVDEQGELLDRAEHDISESVQNTTEGVDALAAAEVYESKTSRKRWIVGAAGAGLTVVGVGVAVVLSPVIGILTMSVGLGGLAVSQTFTSL